MRDERGHVPERHTQVGVHEKDDLTRRLQHAGPHGEPFPPVVRVFDDGDQRITPGGRAGRLHRPVAGRLDDQQDFAEPRKAGGETP